MSTYESLVRDCFIVSKWFGWSLEEVNSLPLREFFIARKVIEDHIKEQSKESEPEYLGGGSVRKSKL